MVWWQGIQEKDDDVICRHSTKNTCVWRGRKQQQKNLFFFFKFCCCYFEIDFFDADFGVEISIQTYMDV